MELGDGVGLVLGFRVLGRGRDSGEGKGFEGGQELGERL